LFVAAEVALDAKEQEAASPSADIEDVDYCSDRSDGSSASVDDYEWKSSSRKHSSLSVPMTLKASLSSHEKTAANVAIEASSNGSFNDWSDWNVESFDERTKHPSKSAEPVGSLETRAHSKVTSSQPLGAEYDILQVKVKAASPKTVEEIDFFADMAPDIKPPKSATLLEVIGNQANTSASRFVVTAADESGVSKCNVFNVCRLSPFQACS
jgi:hypothetical protein